MVKDFLILKQVLVSVNSTTFVGGAEAHVHYSISSRADLMIKGGLNADGTVPVTEIWRNFNTRS
jgi:hypothetical protein